MSARDDRRDDREPPHSIEAEHAVLGALLLDPAAWPRVSGLLTPYDFFACEHQVVFGCLASMLNAGQEVDVVAVFARLAALGQAEEAGGLEYLSALVQSVPSARNIGAHAAIVIERATRRRLIAAADAALSVAWADNAQSIAERIDATRASLAEVLAPEPEALVTLSGLADDLVSRLSDLDERGAADATAGLPTGFATLDRLTNGLQPGSLVVVAARPSVGKSSMALHLALLAARSTPVLVLSLEMRGQEVAARSMAALSGVDGGRIARARLDADEWSMLTAGLGDAHRLHPVVIEDAAGLTLPQIVGKARRTASRYGRVGLIVLDYLQLTAGTDRRANRNLQIEEVSHGLKALAKELQCPVIALAQLNREVEQRANLRPVLADLRDSGAIEQDADIVLLLWRVRRFAGGRHLIGADLAKNRNGPTDAFVLDFDGTTHTWQESSETLASIGRSGLQGNDL